MSILSSEGEVEGWLHYSPQDQTNFSLEGLTKSPLYGSIFLKVCSTWTMYVPVETVNS